MRRVVVRIDRLALRGGVATDGSAIEHGLHAALSRALARHGAFDTLAKPRREARLAATVPRPCGAEALGDAVAGAIVGGAET